MSAVTKLIVLINIFAVFSFASVSKQTMLDIKNSNILNDEIALSKYTIIELPFKIEKNNLRVIMKKKIKKNTSFSEKVSTLNNSLTDNKNIQDNNLLSDKKPPLPGTEDKQNSITNKNKSTNSNNIKIFKNYIEIFPKELGTIELIVFGGSKPVILTFEVKENIDIKYFSFEDSSIIKKSDNLDFNLNSNKKALYLNYFRFLYTNKDIPNFERLKLNEVKDLFDGKIKSVLAKAYRNDKYIIKEYSVTNSLPLNYYIEEDLFINSNTKAISFVSQDNFIYEGETIRYFMIDEL